MNSLPVEAGIGATVVGQFKLRTAVYLDWFGVLASSEVMTRRWRRAEARLLREKYGGGLGKWLDAHDTAFEWYARYWARYGPRSRTDYHKVWVRSEIEWAKRTLSVGGVDNRLSRAELFELDRELVYGSARQVDAMLPQARHVLTRLKENGCKLFLVSGADSDFARGVLEASKAARYFDSVFSPDKINAFKGSIIYWRKILKESGSTPDESIVVDDQPRMLTIPQKLGMKPVLLRRGLERESRFSILKRIEELPALVRRLSD